MLKATLKRIRKRDFIFHQVQQVSFQTNRTVINMKKENLQNSSHSKMLSPGTERQISYVLFTLIELLIVITIIAILAALLLPVLNSARERAKTTSCLSNQKQCGTSLLLYSDAYNGYLPPPSGPGEAGGDKWGKLTWASMLILSGNTQMDKNMLAKPDYQPKLFSTYRCPSVSLKTDIGDMVQVQVFGMNSLIEIYGRPNLSVKLDGIYRTQKSSSLLPDNVNDIFLLADSAYIKGVGSKYPGEVQAAAVPSDNGNVVTRHNGNANCLMLDLSVKSISGRKLKTFGAYGSPYHIYHPNGIPW